MCGISSSICCFLCNRITVNGRTITTLNLLSGTLIAIVTAACKFSRFWYNNFAVWRATREEPRVVTRSPVAPVTWFSDSGGMRSRVANKATGSTQHQLQESPALITRGTIAAVRLSITELRTSRRPFFDFHVSVKNKNIRPITR